MIDHTSSDTIVPSRIAALIACHNRREKTMRCIGSLLSQSTERASLTVFLVDDGSTDGTSDEVERKYPSVMLIRGDGSLYWAGGMRAAFNVARRYGGFDYYLWINDDVIVDADALERSLYWAFNTSETRNGPAVLVGTIRDLDTGDAIYGGMRRPNKWRALYFEPVTSNTIPIPCETCSGNFVLIPSRVINDIGMIDNIFQHGCGDYDYGFRVRRSGYPLMVIPGSVGTCTRNPFPDRNSIIALSFIQRWKRVTSPKLFPLRAWFTYTVRHTGPLWPIFFVRPYVEALFPRIFKILR